jgi:hypothetical protein
VLAAAAILCLPGSLHAQFTDPRTYANAPIGFKQLELDYGYGTANASLDTTLVVPDARIDLNAAALAYSSGFSLFHRLAWAKASLPLADLDGSVSGTSLSRSVTGLGDASLELATLLKGGPALGLADFARFQPTTSVGLSLTVTAPTGQYDADKLLNLGSNRWSFKPEIAIAHPFGRDQRWEADVYFNVSFFSDNTTYHGREILRQEPLMGLEAHLSRGLGSSFWISLDTRYAFRGDTLVESVDQDNSQEGLILGSEAVWSPSSRSSVALVFARAVVHKNAPDYTGVVVKLTYGWGE